MAKKESNRIAGLQGGSYLLVIRVARAVELSVGRLGIIRFEPGYFGYCGSAKRGVKQRVLRHIQNRGRVLRWHIDYFLADPSASIIEAYGFFDEKIGECGLYSKCLNFQNAKAGPRGFGASDCRSGCKSHLVRFEDKPLMKTEPLLHGVKLSG